jgi:hypothetical protein
MAGSRWAACCRGTLTTVLSVNQIVDAHRPYGHARSRRSPASTSTRTNAADAVGPRPSSSVEDTAVRDRARNGVLPHQSERVRRTSKEAYRSELIVAAEYGAAQRTVWLQSAGAVRQDSLSTWTSFGLAASARTSASSPPSEESWHRQAPGPSAQASGRRTSPTSLRWHRLVHSRG